MCYNKSIVESIHLNEYDFLLSVNNLFQTLSLLRYVNSGEAKEALLEALALLKE